MTLGFGDGDDGDERPLDLDMEKWKDEIHNRERQAMFTFEGFALGVVQTVSAAGLFGIVSQIKPLTEILGPIPPRVGLTFFALALGLAVVASLFRYYYKMWDVKSRLRDTEKGRDQQRGYAGKFLRWTRELLAASVILICAALASAVIAMWLVTFDVIRADTPAAKTEQATKPK